MKSLIAVLIVALATPALAQNANVKPPVVGGAGVTRCDKWLSEREKKASALAFALEAWVMGYVSGSYNAVAGDVTFNEDDVLTRIDFYCREHRTVILAAAAAFVTADLLHTEAFRALKDVR